MSGHTRRAIAICPDLAPAMRRGEGVTGEPPLIFNSHFAALLLQRRQINIYILARSVLHAHHVPAFIIIE